MPKLHIDWRRLTLRDNWRWLRLSLAVILLDQISKVLIQHFLRPYQSVPLFSHFNLVCMHNTGAAFSMFNQAPAVWFAALAAIVTLCIVWWLYRHPREQPLIAAGFCLILGGAIGNALDRLTRGFVVDFVDFYIGNWHFAAFNLADSAITFGVGCLILDAVLDYFVLRNKRKSV